MIVITRGRQGVLISRDESLCGAGAYQVEQVGGTGGGDAFAAGYICGLLEGRPMSAAASRYGAAMGRAGLASAPWERPPASSTAEELEAFVARYPFECSVRERALV